jgi:hypothetical protein
MTDGNDERPMRTEAALNPSAVPDPARVQSRIAGTNWK